MKNSTTVFLFDINNFSTDGKKVFLPWQPLACAKDSVIYSVKTERNTPFH